MLRRRLRSSAASLTRLGGGPAQFVWIIIRRLIACVALGTV
jgi:hypothetical protein